MRLKLISCDALYREMCHAVAHSPHQVDIGFLAKGLHDSGANAMREKLQAAVDSFEGQGYDAILFGYALCGNGTAGLRARSIPLVIPRAHDCIALLMGSRERYRCYFESNPTTYFRSTGWLERPADVNQMAGQKLADLVARYGEEKGRYLYNELSRYQTTYRQLTFIRTGVEPGASFEEQARLEAASKGWAFSAIDGDLNLVTRMVCGDWDADDFLVVQPGFQVVARYDERIIDAERVPS